MDNNHKNRLRKIGARVEKLSSNMDVSEFKKLINRAMVEEKKDSLDAIFDSLENKLDKKISELREKDKKPITKEQIDSFKEEYTGTEKLKIGEEEYNFDLTGNIAKDLLYEEMQRNGKDNLDSNAIHTKLEEYLGDKTSESIPFKFHKVQENDRLKYYQLLVKYAHFKIYEKISSNYEPGDYSSVWKNFIKPIMDHGKIFEIGDDIVSILNATDSIKTQAPFNHIILDCKILIDDRIYYGVMYTVYFVDDNKESGVVPESESKGHKMSAGFLSCYSEINKNNGERELYLDFFDEDSLLFKKNKLNKYQKKIISFFYSFCNFINEPEVTTTETILNPRNNKRRADRGAMPLPSNNIIRVSGNLKEYVYNYNLGLVSGYSHRFIVRGHFLHFRDEIRYKNIYTMSDAGLGKNGYQKSNGIIKKWIKPFHKGEGILVDKTYKIMKGGLKNGKNR
jgi:hypothetical protein